MWRAAGWLALLVLGLTHTLEAQRGPRPRPAAREDDTAVRTELAAVLLQDGRYDEAAREYRVLVGRKPDNLLARLGLARALAWGNRLREAERELRVLSARRPYDPEIDELLRSVREGLEPSSPEAAQWLASRPSHTPYRRALARALVRERRPRDALPHYDRLLALDHSPELALEAALAQVAAGRQERAVVLLRAAVAGTPGDTASRHALASVLTQTRQFEPALAHYDTLIAWYPGPELLLERGQIHLERRDPIAAEADASASLSLGASEEAYLMLGRLRRERGDLATARVYYERARALLPDDKGIPAVLARMAREERPVAAFVPPADQADGWRLTSSSVSDNAGTVFATVGAGRDAALLPGLVGSLDVEARHLAEHGVGPDANIPGFAFGFGLAGEVAHGPLLARLGGRGGLVYQADAPTLTSAVAATVWIQAWGLSFERAHGPAYPSLLTAASIVSSSLDGRPLTETTTGAAVGGPLGGADVAVSAQRSDFSDANRRSTLQAVLRLPVTPYVAMISAASGTWFAEHDSLYWAPSSHVAAGLGLEVGARPPRGFGFASRLLAGPARTVEDVRRGRRLVEQVGTSLQLSGGGDLSYRSETHELGIAVTYGTGRTGAYRRFEANAYVRLLR